jgi:Replication protein
MSARHEHYLDPVDPEEGLNSPFWETPDNSEPPDCGDFTEIRKRFDDRTWRISRLAKLALAEGFEAIGKPERARALRNCCTCFGRRKYERGSVLQVAECHDLVCPSGMISRARRHYHRLTTSISKYLDQNPGHQGLMVTLSPVKNCPSQELSSTVNKVIRVVGELMQRRPIKRAWRAWVRSLEITRNEQTLEWHVHVHLCVFVEVASYFRRNSPDFITVEHLKKMLRKQLKADYDPIVDIRRLRGVMSPLGDEGRKSLHEVLKYVLKPGTLTMIVGGRPALVGLNSHELYDPGDGKGLRPMHCVPLHAICDALKGRRLMATSKNLKADDEDLDFTDNPFESGKPRDLGRYLYTEFYAWRSFGRDGDFFLIGLSFDECATEGNAMGP